MDIDMGSIGRVLSSGASLKSVLTGTEVDRAGAVWVAGAIFLSG